MDFDCNELEGLPGDPASVPLGFLLKQPLRNFDLRDEAGASLPLLTKEQNAVSAFTALLTYADALAGPYLSAQVVDHLRTIATGDLDAAGDALSSFRSGVSPLHRDLMGDSVFEQLATTLAHNFILLVPLHAEEGRRVVKFSYVEPLLWPERDRASFLSTLGWIPTPLEFETPAIGEAKSYHFEFTAPPGLGIVRSRMDVEDDGQPETVYEDPEPLTETHLYVSDRRPQERGRAHVWLEPFRSGLVRVSTAAVLVNSLILTLAYFRLDEVAKAATASLLVAIPGLISAFISRPGEHAVATQMLFGVRAVVGASGLVVFLAGLSLIGGFATESLRIIWRPLVLAGWLGVVVTSGAYFGVGSLRRRYMDA